MSEKILSSIIESLGLIISVIIGIIFIEHNNKKKLNQLNFFKTRQNLCEDWIFLNTQCNLLIEEVSKLNKKAAKTVKADFNKKANVKLKVSEGLKYNAGQIAEILSNISYNKEKFELENKI